jgi:hypothetical protein
MARGKSGRIVLEIDPSRKAELYYALKRDGSTLKDWFLRQVEEYLRGRDQVPLISASAVSEEPTQYRVESQPAALSRAKGRGTRARAESK